MTKHYYTAANPNSSQHSKTLILLPIVLIIFMGFSRNLNLLSSLLTYLFSFTYLVCAMDTITSSQLIKEPQTLRSNNSMFTLGFFTPQNSTNRYVGIWFMSESNVVWVANRNEPLTDSSGIVTISENGNLVILNSTNQVVWSTNVSNMATNSSAQLLDSGNLVLIDKTSGNMVWESFKHPCDTLLQDMKLSTNAKTGEKVQFISWKSTSDPSYGSFSCSLESHNVAQVFIWEGNRRYWRSGPWNSHDFLGIARMDSLFLNGFRIDEVEGTFNLYFNFANKSILRTFSLSPQGKLEQQLWNFEAKEWEKERIINQESECDVYGLCGPFGVCNPQKSPICSCLQGFEPKNILEWDRQNWTSGCERRKVLQCEMVNNNGSQASKEDGFLKLERTKVPDFVEWLLLESEVTEDCRTPCLKNCSCIAYAYDAGLGCMFWSSDLFDIQIFSEAGVDLYIRLADSELDEGRNVTTIVIIAVLIGTILITASVYFLWKRMSKQKGEMHTQLHKDNRIKNLKQVRIQELSLFDFRNLATATNNFDLANKLGQGGFGPVYKGKLQNGLEIAVKRLSRASGQGMEEFINEVELISKLQHRNLVRLIGCCIEREEEILVYEYMPNKSLDAYIFDLSKKKSLDWVMRYNIIEGIARGLVYLHRDSRLRIIHRDLKASNILLDEGMNPKISDFGMAKIFGGNEDQAKTRRIVGTYGYISPEYATEGLFSEKSDVFSYGVLLLEIVSGRRNTSFFEDAESLTLLGFAWKLWNEEANIIPLIDPQIYDPSFHNDMLRCIHIGLLCVQELARDRPIMATVISMLHSEIMDIPPPRQPAFVLKQTMPCNAEAAQDNDELCTINNVTVSKIEGR